ncbi:hypothetical protein U7230_11050 [Carboxydochorda subterranea]|uniref:CopG family transcriptional regulator n=1 Tax=Carboxydichorda subterranea TaxID=3109565 RepID=A0ABZ1BV15_9FIRM|nr:hypothetical protein [Limnochorda sp. L945t]WRP16624.1 hypothetical protein U7230_11050 [Limnochorda sp. L945t]
MEKLYPPDTDDIEQLARFFDEVDSMDLAEIEEVRDVPARELVHVSVQLPKEDVQRFRRLAEREKIPYTTLIRCLLHKVAVRLS